MTTSQSVLPFLNLNFCLPVFRLSAFLLPNLTRSVSSTNRVGELFRNARAALIFKKKTFFFQIFCPAVAPDDPKHMRCVRVRSAHGLADTFLLFLMNCCSSFFTSPRIPAAHLCSPVCCLDFSLCSYLMVCVCVCVCTHDSRVQVSLEWPSVRTCVCVCVAHKFVYTRTNSFKSKV